MRKPCQLIGASVVIFGATAALAAPVNGPVPKSRVTASAPVPVTVWTWLLTIRDVNYPADELTLDMYVTFTYDLRFKDKINPMKHFDIVEAKSVALCEQDEEPRAERGEYYQSFRCVAVIAHHWDIGSFPFDRHKIRLRIEDSMDKIGKLLYVASPDEWPRRNRD